jgi:hypothetical protein
VALIVSNEIVAVALVASVSLDSDNWIANASWFDFRWHRIGCSEEGKSDQREKKHHFGNG